MYNHWEVRYARDKRYKLYGGGALYDTVDDVMETHILAPAEDTPPMKRARKTLQEALDCYPKAGGGIRYSEVKGVMKAPKKK